MRRRAPRWLAAVTAVASLAVVPAGTTIATVRPQAPETARPASERALPALLASRPWAAAPAPTSGAVAGVLAAADEVPILPPPATLAGPTAAPADLPPALRAASFGPEPGGVWAVVVGIDDYPGSGSDLRASVNDADATEAALLAYGVPAHRIVVLRDRQASAATIRASLGWLVDRAASDATAVFFYAGHIRKLAPGSEAIVAADGQLVTDADVAWDLKHLRARHTWIALAACYAGGFTEVLAPGRILTGAADSTSLAYESAAYGRSYLGEFMIQRAMRNGWAAGSVEEAFAWAQEELRREHPRRLLVQYDMTDDQVVLGAPPAAQPLPEPTTASAPSEPSQPQPQPQPESTPPPPSEPEEEGGCLLLVLGDCREDD